MNDEFDDGEMSLLEAQRLKAEAFPLISVKELASLLRVSVRTLRRYQAAGKAPIRIKHGRQIMYRKSDLHLWPKSQQGHKTRGP